MVRACVGFALVQDLVSLRVANLVRGSSSCVLKRPQVVRRQDGSIRKRAAIRGSSDATPTPLRLPWECEQTKASALITTSYDAAHVVSSDLTLIPGYAVLVVDMSTTNVPVMYSRAGQYVFIKPWGDEDGLCAPYAMWTPPGYDNNEHTFVVRQDSHVGNAALNGELLEVSTIYGAGFRTSPQDRIGSSIVGLCSIEHAGPLALAVKELLPSPTDVSAARLIVLCEKEGSNLETVVRNLIHPSLAEQVDLITSNAELDSLGEHANDSTFVLHATSELMQQVSSQLARIGVPSERIVYAE